MTIAAPARPKLSQTELEAFGALSAEEQSELIELIEQKLGKSWTLAPKQRLAIALWGKVDYMLYGGSAGGGKSEMACWHANNLSKKIDGHNSLLIRKAIPELRRSLILRMIARNKQFNLGNKLRKPDGITGFYYENNSSIECGYLASEEHLGQYLSAEYDCIIIDEASQLEWDWIVQIAGRLRTTKEKASRGARPHLGLFTNPGGPAHAELYDLFVVPCDYGNRVVVYDVSNGIEPENRRIVREYTAPLAVRGASKEEIEDVLIPWAESLEVQCDPETELAVAFVPSRATDNPHVAPSMMKFLNALPLRRRKQLRDGDWDTFEGMFFEEWNPSIHVIPAFDIPDSWTKARALDFGTASPFCCLWLAWDEDGDCYVYREAYAAGLDPDQQATQVLEMSTPRDLVTGGIIHERYQHTVADPSVFSNHRGIGKEVASLWANAGLHVSRARNARIAGWANVRQYLRPDEEGKSKLHVFDSCRNLRREFSKAQHDKKNQEDLDTNGSDHALDCIRYGLGIRPMGAPAPRKLWQGGADAKFSRAMKRQDHKFRKGRS